MLEKKMEPIDFADIIRQDFGFNLKKFCRLTTRYYDFYLKLTDLRLTQVNMLLLLASQGCKSITDSAKVLGMDRSTFSRNLLPLVQKGFVCLDSHPRFKIKQYALTPKGKNSVKISVPLLEKANKNLKTFFANMGYDIMAEMNKMSYQDVLEFVESSIQQKEDV